ncbi:hypothetical protein BH10ACT7_BH10ACT7_24010 [soil metagenome]
MYYIPAHLKDMNRQMIYQIIAGGDATSRAQLSRDSGISLPTVNKTIKHFIDLGIVHEIDDSEDYQEGRLGRRPQLIRFNSGAFLAVGVEYEGESIRVGLVDLSGQVRALRVSQITGLGEDTANAIVEIVEELIAAESIDRSILLGVGIGLPGVVDIENRTVNAGPMVGVFQPTSLDSIATTIEQRLGLPVAFDNDVNAAAIGEYTVRGSDPRTDLVFLSLGTGFGGGIILNGQLWRGRHNFAGEFGYMIFDEHSESQTSQVGWLEARIGLHAASRPAPEFVATQLALAMANIAMVIGVELFVVGGTAVTRLGEGFVRLVSDALARFSDLPLVVQASVCPEPGVVGAASLAIANTLNERWND